MMNPNFWPAWVMGDFKKCKEYKLLNRIENMNTFMDLVNSRLDTFEWGNLPVGVDSRLLEASLLFRGMFTLFTEDGGQTFNALPASLSENINSQGNYLFAYAYGANGYIKKVKLYLPGITENPAVTQGIGMVGVGKEYDAVLCRENASGYPFIYTITLSTLRLSNIMRAMDTAVETLKVPYVIKCEESLKDSVKEMYKRVRDNDPIIIGSKGLGLEALEILPTSVDTQILAEFREQYNFLQGEIQSKMGAFHNAQPDKNAHILQDELHSDDASTENELQKCLTYRRKFCDECREAFGLNITVKVRNRNITSGEIEGGEVDGINGNRREDYIQQVYGA